MEISWEQSWQTKLTTKEVFYIYHRLTLQYFILGQCCLQCLLTLFVYYMINFEVALRKHFK